MTAASPRRELRLLAEIGFMATIRVPGFDGTPIFDALDAVQPEHTAAPIGRALQALARRDPRAAVLALERDGITRPIGREDARSMLVVALAMAGEHDRARAAAAALDESAGPAHRLAHAVLAGLPPSTTPPGGNKT